MGNKTITDQELAAQLKKPSGELGLLVAEKMSQNNAFLYKQAFELMHIQETDHVLEIGFGHGKFLTQIVQQASRGWVAGLDFSEDMVQEAQSNYDQLVQAGQLEISQGSISAIPYPDNRFNKVFSLNTLYFIDDPLRALQEIHRVLKPRGMCGIGIRTSSTMKKHAFTQYGFTLFELSELTVLLQKAGFSHIQYKHEQDTVAREFDALTITGIK